MLYNAKLMIETKICKSKKIKFFSILAMRKREWKKGVTKTGYDDFYQHELYSWTKVFFNLGKQQLYFTIIKLMIETKICPKKLNFFNFGDEEEGVK